MKTLSENSRQDAIDSPGAGNDHLGICGRSGSEEDGDDPLKISKRRAQGWHKARCNISIISIILVVIFIALVVFRLRLDAATDERFSNSTDPVIDSGLTCMDDCKINIVETIPVGMVYPNDSVIHPSTYHSWTKLISSARSSIDIASLYFDLRRGALYPGDGLKMSEDVFEALLEAGRDREVRLRIVRNAAALHRTNADSDYLSMEANAQVGALNDPRVYMHAKFWVVDNAHFYLGSANVGWEGLTQAKELGLLAVNCSCLAEDIAKIFEMYWKTFEDGKIPATWPESLETRININNPMILTSGGNSYRVFIAISPPAMLPKGRTDDLDAILYCIDKAEKFISIDLKQYTPLKIRQAKLKYWPVIDDALRTAAIEWKVHIRMLINWCEWSHRADEYFLNSLTALVESYKNVNIEVKIFIIPHHKESHKIPNTRYSHNKYLVTDTAAYIGSSNWVGDYFYQTTGIGIIFESVGNETTGNLRQQLEDTFDRDWTSDYAHPLNTTYSDRRLLKYAEVVGPGVHDL